MVSGCLESRTSSCWSCSRKSSTVLSRPSARGMRARHPSSARRLTSSCFFGVPSGLLASQRISPPNPVARATASANSRMVRSTPVPTFRWVRGWPASSRGAFGASGSQCSRANTQASPRSSACKNSRRGEPVPQQVTVGSPRSVASWKRRIRAGSTWLLVGW